MAYGVLEISASRSRVLDHKNIGHADAAVPYGVRLSELAHRIDQVMNKWCPDVVGYEDQAGVAVGNAERESDAVNFASHWVHDVCGMLRFAAACALETPVPCYTAPPQSIKVAVLGKGARSADKKQIKHAIRTLFGVTKCSSHEADAIAMAVAALRRHRRAELAQRKVGAVIA